MARKTIKLIAILVLLILLFIGCASKQEKEKKFISKGIQLAQKGEYKKAILEYKNALQLNPKNPKTLVLLGKCYLNLKQYRKAYSLFLNAININPDYDEAKIELANILLLARDTKKAMEYIDSIKEKDKFEPRISLLKARGFIMENKYKDAVKILKNLKNIENNKQAQILLSISYRYLGQYKKMEQAIERWRKIDPTDYNSYIFMADYWKQKGKMDKAIVELNKMTKANSNGIILLIKAIWLEKNGLIDLAEKDFELLPAKPEFLREKALFYIRHKKTKKAITILNKLISQDPADIKSNIMLAELLFNSGKQDLAFEKLDEAIKNTEKKEDKVKLLYLKAEFYFKLHKIEKAKELCNEILKENQAMIEAHLLLGKILFLEGKLDEAEVHLSQVAVAQPKNIEAQILLARCLMLNKKEKIAEDTLKKAIKINPNANSLYVELSGFYLKKKRYEDAKKLLSSGIEKNQEDVLLIKLRGELNLLLKNYEAAKKDFKRIIRLKPDITLGYMEMGRLYASKNDYKNAIIWFRKAYEKKGGFEKALPAILDIYFKQKKFNLAIQFLNKELKNKPNSAAIYYYLGVANYIKGDFKSAENWLVKAIKTNPNLYEPYKMLSEIYIKKGEINKAISKLKDSFSKSPTLRAGTDLAILYEHVGEIKKALEVYENLLKKYENNPILLNNIAYLYAEYYNDNDHLKKAKKLVTKLMSLQNIPPSFLDTAALVEYKLGNTDLAWNYIQNALSKLETPRPVILLHAAIIAHKLGLKKEAKNYLNQVISQKLDIKARKKALNLIKEWKK